MHKISELNFSSLLTHVMLKFLLKYCGFASENTNSNPQKKMNKDYQNLGWLSPDRSDGLCAGCSAARRVFVVRRPRRQRHAPSRRPSSPEAHTLVQCISHGLILFQSHLFFFLCSN
jgi:hypothetical protein